MPDRNREIVGLQEIPQFGDTTTVKTVFTPAPSFGEVNNSVLKSTTESFIEKLHRVIENINQRERVRRNGWLTNLAVGRRVEERENGGEIY